MKDDTKGLTRLPYPMTATLHVDGPVAPGFEEVRAEFERTLSLAHQFLGTPAP